MEMQVRRGIKSNTNKIQ